MNAGLGVLVEVAVRGGLLLALAGVIALALRHRSAELRHAVWLAGLVGMLVLPLVTSTLPGLRVPILPAQRTSLMGPPTIVLLDEPGSTEPVVVDGSRTSVDSRRPRQGQLLFGLWVAGALLFAVRAFDSHRRLAAVVKTARPLGDPQMARALALASTAIGVRPPTCLWSDRIDVPLAAGWRRPLLLLPRSARAWSDEHRRSVLLHELSHLRRRDPLWLAVAQVATAFYWFHPLVWLAARQLRSESERACDDAVLRSGERASGYADTLLAMALKWTSSAPAAGVAFVRPSGLEPRIAAILTARLDRRRLSRGQSWSVAAAGILLSLALAIANPAPAAEPTPTPTPAGGLVEHDLESLRAHLDSILTGPVGYRNEPDAPVLILEANANGRVEGHWMKITKPNMRLANRDVRGVRAVRLALDLPSTRDRIWVRVNIPAGKETFLDVPSRLWSSVVQRWEARAFEIQIVGVEFTNGTRWVAEGPIQLPRPRPMKVGMRETPAPETPIAPDMDRRLHARADPDGPTIPARFRNPAGAEVVIVEARTPLTPRIEEKQPHTWLPRIRVENRTDRRVVYVRVRYKSDGDAHAVSGFDVSIEPHAGITLAKDAYPVWGRAEDMKVQLLGVQFADGSIWGTLDSSIDARDTWVYPLEGDAAR